jgi:4-hydroxymandelate oxidase
LSAVERYREQARSALPAEVWNYLEAGADDGLSLAAAAEAWRRMSLRPRILRGVAEADPSTTLLGAPAALPVMIAPNGRATRYHPDGEKALLAGAAAAGIVTLLASSVVDSLAPLRRLQPDAIVWQQLYMAADRAVMRDRLAAVAEHGGRAVVLTADLLPGGTAAPPQPPRAAWELPGRPSAGLRAATLDDLAWLCSESRLPVVVKGVLRGDDADLCFAAGAAALIVSNHGGNQLDTVISPAEALEEVVAAGGDRGEIYVDGGIRRGTSVLKALALGATAALVGRPASYALTAGGAQAVAAMIEDLGAELRRAMALCGAATVGNVDRSLVTPGPGVAPFHQLDLPRG